MKKNYKHVFIDLDDTLWDFHTNARLSLKNLFEEMSLADYFSDFDHFFSLYKNINNELWKLYGEGKITKAQLSAERFNKLFAQVGIGNANALSQTLSQKYLELLPTRTALMPYASEALVYLSGKYPLTIISNGFVEVQHKKIQHSNIGRFFTHIVFSENVGALKPDKKIFRHALNINNAKPENTIMIGDNFEADIVGAHNADIDTVFYNFRKENINPKASTYTITSLEEIKNIL